MNEFLSEPPACIEDAGSWCQQVWKLTGNEWLAGSADWLVVKPLRILLIVALAVIVRYLIRKLINRATRDPKEDVGDKKVPALLRPLKERAPEVLGPAVIERRRQRARTIGSVLKSLSTVLVYGLAFVMVLGEFGINLAPILASAGILGVALGFGAQNLVRDFLSGLFMMLEDQYGVGDVVDVGEATGTVEAVGLRITTLRDINGTVWYVRNGEVLRVGNSSQGYAVAVVDIPLSYQADISRATVIMEDAAAETVAGPGLASDVLEAPEMLGVESVTADAIQLRLTAKVRPGKQWSVQRKLRADIKQALENAGFEPPLGRLYGPARAAEPGAE